MKSFVVSALSLAVMALPVGAAEWQSVEDKNLFLHTIQEGTARLELVCDPEGAWLPPEYHVVVTPAPGQFLEGTTIEVRTETETQTFPLSGGSVVSREPEVWNKVVATLSKPGPITFSAGGQDVSFTIEDELKADCTI